MPIREYRCPQCHTEFEELVFGDDLPPCSACGARGVQPLMSRCCVRGGGEDGFSPPSGSGSGCSGCAGGNCGSCQ